MASVVFSAGIDSVSGALSKPKKGGQHASARRVEAGSRHRRLACAEGPRRWSTHLEGLHLGARAGRLRSSPPGLITLAVGIGIG